MKASAIALLGLCLVLVAHGIPVFISLGNQVPATKGNGISTERLGATKRSIATSYSSSLSSTSEMFQRVDGDPDEYYYFDAIRITAPTTGTFKFTSDSELDTMGYFYETSFDPSEPTANLVTYDDDGGDIHLQFNIEPFLQAGRTYILVVTTHLEFETGSFSVSASGPEPVNLISITPSTSRPMIIPTTVPTISSSYSSSLSSTSGMFQRVDGDPDEYYYFDAIQITAPATGTFKFTSDSELDTLGYLYETSFDPSEPTVNLITYDDDGGDIHFQFEIEAFLQAGHTYILVVTTHLEFETGSFSVSASGPEHVNLISITPSTSRPMIIPTTVPTITSSHSGSLSSSSMIFHRPDGDTELNYYYHAIQITVPATGTYTFTSDSELDTMGYFYETSFDPSEPTVNLITYDDDGGDIHLQFEIEAFLQAGHTYILVVTTHMESETGSFSVSASGLESIAFTSTAP